MSSGYSIFETKTFQKNLGRMPLADRRRLEKKLEEFVYSRLREFPHFGPSIKKIKGLSPGTWRYRIGKWRVFYEIDEEDATVIMLAVADRKSAYR